MLRKLLSKVEEGRFGRALAGLQAGWHWVPRHRVFVSRGVELRGFVQYSSKEYSVIISPKVASCSCHDFVVRGVLCKHIAFVALAELSHAAAERSAHRQVQENQGWPVGQPRPFGRYFLVGRCPATGSCRFYCTDGTAPAGSCHFLSRQRQLQLLFLPLAWS